MGYIGGHETRNHHHGLGGGVRLRWARGGTGGRSPHGKDRENRCRVAGAVDARAVPRDAAARDGARLHGGVPRPPRGGHLPLRGLRSAAVFVGRQVRVGHGLAELFPAGGAGARGGTEGPQPRHGAHGGALRAVRRALGARVRRRAAADGAALLHQLRRAAVRAPDAGEVMAGERPRRMADISRKNRSLITIYEFMYCNTWRHYM